MSKQLPRSRFGLRYRRLAEISTLRELPTEHARTIQPRLSAGLPELGGAGAAELAHYTRLSSGDVLRVQSALRGRLVERNDRISNGLFGGV